MTFLDIGSGPQKDKQPGFFYLDVRNVPGVDYVQDARDLSMFPDEAWHGIVAQDVIEHLPFRDVPATLKEWMRVLKTGGKMILESPDAFYCYTLLIGHGPTWVSGEDLATHFNRVTFGHQDYPENFHKSLWTPEWVEAMLPEARYIERVEAERPGSFRLVVTK